LGGGTRATSSSRDVAATRSAQRQGVGASPRVGTQAIRGLGGDAREAAKGAWKATAWRWPNLRGMHGIGGGPHVGVQVIARRLGGGSTFLFSIVPATRRWPRQRSHKRWHGARPPRVSTMTDDPGDGGLASSRAFLDPEASSGFVEVVLISASTRRWR
jgi:hypothetical protein